MKNLKNEINSRFMGDRSRTDYLADLLTEEIKDLNERMSLIENAMSIMQEVLVRIELSLPVNTEESIEKPKKRSGRKKKH
jgi:hypothetical protein